MAKSKNKSEDKSAVEKSAKPTIRTRTWHIIIGILFLVICVVLIVAPTEKAGLVGHYTYRTFEYLFGHGYYLLPILAIFIGYSFFRSIKPKLMWASLSGGVALVLSSLAMLDLIVEGLPGGVVGYGIAFVFEKLFGGTVATVVSAALIAIGGLIVLETQYPLATIWGKLMDWWEARRHEKESEVQNEIYPDTNEYIQEEPPQEDGGLVDGEINEDEPTKPEDQDSKGGLSSIFGFVKNKEKEAEATSIPAYHGPYTPPPLSLLTRDSGKPMAGDIKANANIIKRTLINFGIEVEMDEISIGPSITRYALKPAEGVKLSRIVGLQKELSLALAAHPLRIEAPIPGKSLVGIEIPNNIKTTVRLGSLLSLEEFANSQKPLLISLGRGVSGLAHFTDLAKAPHMLIAGTTGSGKSVVIHTLIASLLYRNSPENLRFILIDPKRVELTLYNKIPHLLTPVITDPKKAIQALKWAAKEMERRYDILQAEAVRDINSYHDTIFNPAINNFQKKVGGMSEDEARELEQNLPESMPYIVLVIDELADMMTSYPREMEAGIVRLAQMSRAVGIHLVLSTQRPSTEVITGLIKANVPARIALQVPSQIDSRTIIDMPGAEKLLGAGDMLYLSADSSKPQRIQSSFITEEEVKKVAKHLSDQAINMPPTEINIAEADQNGNKFSVEFGDDDAETEERYEEAREIVIETGKASISYLQRKMGLGYGRAAKIIDMLERNGVVGAGQGAKPREVLIKKTDYGAASTELANDIDAQNKNDDESI